MPGLQLENIYHSYRKDGFGIENINMYVRNDEVVCLLGPSGCGKSTILKLISGLERTKSGTIKINGTTVDDNKTFVPTGDRNIGLIFQHPSLFAHKTVLDNVKFGIHESKYCKEKAMEMLECVGMSKFADFYPRMLSGGQQQMVTIARAIAQEPNIILLDEPFSNLDVLSKTNIKNYVLSLVRTKKIATLIVTHDPNEALELSDRIYVMKNGQIWQTGTPYEIYNNPTDHILASFFSNLNQWNGTVKKNQIVSPFGIIPAENFNDEEKIIVVFKTDAISICEDSPYVATVKDTKFFNNMIYIEVEEFLFWIKSSTSLLPSIGDKVFLSLDLNKVLLFKV